MSEAKEIYSMDLVKIVDRTTQPHSLGRFDVDVMREPHPANSFDLGKRWTYCWTVETFKKAEKSIKKFMKKAINGTKMRIVDNQTGEILFESKET